MSWILKVVIVLFCFCLCGAGTFIVSTAREENRRQNINVIPVKNHEVVRRPWTQV